MASEFFWTLGTQKLSISPGTNFFTPSPFPGAVIGVSGYGRWEKNSPGLPMPKDPRSLLIIHSGGIGDLLLALPAMRMFRQAFAGGTLTLMGRPERLSLVRFDLQAASIHSIDRAGMAYFYLEEEPLPAELSSFFAQFAAALVFGKENLPLFSKNLRRAGISRILSVPPFPPEGLGMHVSDYLCQSLRSQGTPGRSSPGGPLRLPGEALAFAMKFREENRLERGSRVLAIHPGSGSPEKNWAPERFARVARWGQEHARVLLLSGPAETDQVEKIRRAIRKEESPLAMGLPLIHLAAVLQGCTAYLGNDSGITHLAASLGVPTVALFGPTDPAVWGPRGAAVKILAPPFPLSSGGRRSLQLVEPEEVIEAVSPFLFRGTRRA